MNVSHPLSADALSKVKKLALRFSKELEQSTGTRIRGVKLYDAFAKVAGYESFNQAKNHASRSSSDFNYESFVYHSKRMIRKHLPTLLKGEEIIKALESAQNPGVIQVGIDISECPNRWRAQFENLPGFIAFQQNAQERQFEFPTSLSVRRQSKENFDTRKQTAVEKPITIDVDFSQWKDESTPFNRDTEWKRFFLEMVDVIENGRDMEVQVTKHQNGKTHKLKGFKESKGFVWERINQEVEVVSMEGEAFNIFDGKGFNIAVFPPSGHGKSIATCEAPGLLTLAKSSNDKDVDSEIELTMFFDESPMPHISPEFLEMAKVINEMPGVEKPKLDINLSEVPKEVVKLITQSAQYKAIEKLIGQRDIECHLITAKGHIEQPKENWKIRASFESYGAEEIPINAIVSWNEFRNWILRFQATGRVVVAERIESSNWLRIHTQHLTNTTREGIKNELKSHDDRVIFELLDKG